MTPTISTAIVFAAFLLQCFIWLAFAVGYRRSRIGLPRVISSPARAPARDLTRDPACDVAQPPDESRIEYPAVSVVVAARNEELQLPDLIDALDAQSFEDFEMIIVDDLSDDATVALVRDASKTRPWLRLVQILEPDFPRKKTALKAGIAAAKNDVLVFTDADCRPLPDWLFCLSQMHARHHEDVVVVGYALFDREAGLLNRFARYVALVTSFQAAATIGLNVPFMAFGTNLSYQKSTFDSVGGFADGLASVSGDDDLFVQRVHALGAARIVWMADRNAIVRTRAMTSVRTWLVQKKRHTSANRYFRRPVKIAGFIYWFSLTAVFLGPVFAGWLGLAGLVGWMLIHAFCLGNAFCHFEAKDLIPRLPALVMLYSVFNAILPVLGFIHPSKRWK